MAEINQLPPNQITLTNQLYEAKNPFPLADMEHWNFRHWKQLDF